MPRDAPSLPAGWYPHPDDPARQIKWDGSRWTGKSRPHPVEAPEVVISEMPAEIDDHTRHQRKVKWLVLSVITALVVVSGGIWGIKEISDARAAEQAATVSDGNTYGPDLNFTPPPPDPVSLLPEVTYEVTGTADTANLTFTTPTGTSQIEANLPLKHKDGGPLIVRAPSGAFLYISAQNTEGYGSVTCKISVNGVTISQNTSKGAYKIAACKGRVP